MSVTSSAVAFIGLVMAGSVAIQLARTQRGKLTTQHPRSSGSPTRRSSSFGKPAAVRPAYEPDAFVPLAPVIAWTLLAVGHALHLITRWM